MHKCPQRHTEEGRRFGQATETSLQRLSEIPPGSSAKDQQHLPAPGELGCLGPRSPSLVWMLGATIVPITAHGSDGAAPIPVSPRNFLGGLSRSPAAGSTTHRSSTSLRGDKSGSRDVSNNERTAGPERAERRRHKPQGCAAVACPRATASTAPSPVSHPFAPYKHLTRHRWARGARGRSRPLVPHRPPFLSRGGLSSPSLGANGSRYKSAAKERGAPCQPRCRGLCSATRAGGCDTPVLPEGILPCPAPGRAESPPQHAALAAALFHC